MSEVEGKVAFITGASSGIGLGIARAFAEAGMCVVLGYQTRQHIDSALTQFAGAESRIHSVHVDVTDRRSIEEAASETLSAFGKVHVLVSNAGVQVHQPLSETSADDWDWLLGVNLGGTFNCVKTFLPHIKKHGEGGHIL